MTAWLRAARVWMASRWPGPVPATGFAIIIVEFGALLAFHRAVDKELMPVAIALILWQPQRRRQTQRNRRRAETIVSEEEEQ